MATFVYRNGQMVNKATGEPMVNRDEWVPVTPRVVSDIDPYQSPVTGEPITSRNQERDHMKEHNVIPTAELRKPSKLKNERFIEKHGLQHLAE